MRQLLLAVAACLATSLSWAQNAPDGDLHIIVLEGEDGVNIIKDKTAVKPVVEVRDKNNLPVAGALVYFLIPRGGAGGKFVNGEQTISAITDASGRASASSLTPSGKGAFNIEVRASYQGRTATTTIRQVNFETVQAAQQAGKTPGSSQSAANNGATTSSSSSGSTAASTASSAVGSSAGMSGATIAGIAGGVAAAGAAGAYYSTKQKTESNSCDAQFDALMPAINNVSSRCTATASEAQCNSAIQSLLDGLGRACSCVGSGGMDAETRSMMQPVLTWLRSSGINTNQYSACLR